MARGITLSFATITCDRCRATRLLTQACPECGLRPRRHETQPDLERRRKVLAAFKNAKVEPPLVTDSLEEAMAKVPSLIDDILRELGKVGAASRSPQGVTHAFARLDAQVQYWAQRHPRPSTNRARQFGYSLKLLRDGIGVFAEALGAESLLAAQALQVQGQALLDAAGEEIGKLQEIGIAESLLSGPAAYAQIGENARAVAGGDERLALLDERLREMSGGTTDASQMGIGLNLLVLRHLTLVLFDLSETMEVARAAEARMGDLTAVCSSANWQARHGVVTAQLSIAAFNLSSIDEDNDLEAASAALQIVMQCRDGVIRHCLATMFAGTAADYDRLSAKSAGYLIKRATQDCADLRLNENLSEVLRHAAAHYDYDVTETHLVTRTSSGEEALTIDEFIDSVLGYLQTAVSLLMALIRTTARQGIQFDLSRHTPERDIFGCMVMLLGLLGFTDASIEKDGPVLRVTGNGDVNQLATAVAGMVAVAPANLHRVEGVITSPERSQPHLWEAPLDAFRAYASRPVLGSDLDEMLALVRVTASVRVDGEPVWDHNKWAAMAMHVFNETKGMSTRERVVRFKQIRDHTADNGFSDVASALTTILEGVRQGRDSEPLPASALMRPTSIF
nr:hypothetical protein [uncultured Nocardioides sp.]